MRGFGRNPVTDSSPMGRFCRAACFPSPGSLLVPLHADETMPNRLLVVTAVILATAGCATPKFQADVATQLHAAADELQQQRQDMSLLQEQIDSLKVVAAKQDSLLKKLANLAGVPGPASGEQGTR
jgi:hypothetical protein